MREESTMARADLLKKLFSNFKTNDREGFVRIANEIIEDERKKNHVVLADELRMIINNGSSFSPKSMSALAIHQSNGNGQQPALYEIIYPDKTLSDVVLAEENRVKINQVIREFTNWDVLMSNGVCPIRRVLFYGPPGCGKTMTASVIAAEIGLPLLYVRFDAIISSYLGETAGNLRKVFDFVNGESYVMLFDEFDAIARSRNDQYEHGEIKRVVNTFLQQIDNFKGRSLVIAATNFEQSLDYAIWRRFDSTLRFDMPSNYERFSLFNLKLKQFKGSDSIIAEFAADMENFSHADVERSALAVIKQCILDGRRMYTKKDVEQAVYQQKELVSLRKTQYRTEG
jgi:AAA+ superfamily predicted ATPase